MTKRTFAGLATAAVLLTSPAFAGDASHQLDAARAKAAESGKPVLVKIGTEWCSACKAFDAAVAENAAFRTEIIEDAILVQVDAEKGSGVDIAHDYNVHGYPSFVLTNAEGEVLDRWMGFAETSEFTETLATAASDPVTIDARAMRFAKNATEADALKLGDLRLADGHYGDAVQYYRRAASLNAEMDHAPAIFRAVAWGAKKGVFSTDDVRAEAEAVFASSQASGKDLMQVAYTMRGVAERAQDMAYYTPFLKAAYERTADAEGWVAETRSKMAAQYVLHVEKDPAKALETKRASMPEGWKDDANLLNNFAWWCFENKLNLEDAEKLARRGAELAADGKVKAMILDTVAELCNLNGNCGEALDIIRLAMSEDPENDYYKQQEERFAELLAAQESR